MWRKHLGLGSVRVRSFRLPSPGLGLGYGIGRRFPSWIRQLCLVLGTMLCQVARHRIPSHSGNDCGNISKAQYLQAYRRYHCHVMTGDGSSSWNSPSSLHTPTALDRAYSDRVNGTVTSRTNPRYSHRVHVTVMIPQV
ncbi:UNVERIFIED_CONTAM: hypothetical protein Sradi_3245400 [Sesamum radiatum]|uniref:Uncharacterized protein n=1 Tax=Sesamum radiatum TaxID=300843 RepID=A0AAW2QZN4_SESRA